MKFKQLFFYVISYMIILSCEKQEDYNIKPVVNILEEESVHSVRIPFKGVSIDTRDHTILEKPNTGFFIGKYQDDIFGLTSSSAVVELSSFSINANNDSLVLEAFNTIPSRIYIDSVRLYLPYDETENTGIFASSWIDRYNLFLVWKFPYADVYTTDRENTFTYYEDINYVLEDTYFVLDSTPVYADNGKHISVPLSIDLAEHIFSDISKNKSFDMYLVSNNSIGDKGFSFIGNAIHIAIFYNVSTTDTIISGIFGVSHTTDDGLLIHSTYQSSASIQDAKRGLATDNYYLKTGGNGVGIDAMLDIKLDSILDDFPNTHIINQATIILPYDTAFQDSLPPSVFLSVYTEGDTLSIQTTLQQDRDRGEYSIDITSYVQYFRKNPTPKTLFLRYILDKTIYSHNRVSFYNNGDKQGYVKIIYSK